MHDDRFVQIAKALADPTRRRILDAVRASGDERPTCSCMVRRFDLSQPTISHHIRVLERAGLLRVCRSGPFHVLAADERTLAAFAAALLAIPDRDPDDNPPAGGAPGAPARRAAQGSGGRSRRGGGGRRAGG